MTAASRFTDPLVGDIAFDDRLLPLTRWVARLLAPALLVACVILYVFPDRTTELFAWTIRPDMTPIIMGAGYGTGAYFFYRVATATHWHRVAIVFPGIAVFTWFMAGATVLHWENFNHGHVTFLIWTFLYAVSPLLVPAIWYLNRRTDPGVIADGEVRLPQRIRWVSGASGLLITLTSTALFVVPDILIDTWAWDISPLTARILVGWFVLFGVGNLAVAFDPRWTAARLYLQTKVLGFGLILIGVIRAWDDFDTANPMTWGFVGGFAVYLLALVVLYYSMDRR